MTKNNTIIYFFFLIQNLNSSIALNRIPKKNINPKKSYASKQYCILNVLGISSSYSVILLNSYM